MPKESVKEQLKKFYEHIVKKVYIDVFERDIEPINMPWIMESIPNFFSESWKSLKFIFSEKENIFFALFQVTTVALGYCLWVQMISWIPQSTWENTAKSINDLIGVLIVLFLWTFICVLVVTYLLGILTACFCISYMLKELNRKCSLFECLKIALNKSYSLWVFSRFDAWKTLERIFYNMYPGRSSSTSIRCEGYVYQMWKISSLCILPALIYGRTVFESFKDSLLILKKYFDPIVKLRAGYSAICWVIVVLSCFSLLFLCPHIMAFQEKHNLSALISFCVYVSIPTLISIVLVMFIRPLYIISATRYYLDFVCMKQIKGHFPNSSEI